MSVRFIKILMKLEGSTYKDGDLAEGKKVARGFFYNAEKKETKGRYMEESIFY